MSRFRNGYRVFAVIAAFVGLLSVGPASAQQQPVLVIASFGGEFQDQQRKAFFDPFTKATGIKVVDVAGAAVPKVRAMVQTGNVEWDVFQTSAHDYPEYADGLTEPIDYSKIDKAVLAQMLPHTVQKFGLATDYVSQVIAWNTKSFPGNNHPQSWKDVWDVKRFPGPRMLTAGTYSIEPIEPALMAAGVPKGKIYPVDLDKAYAMLTAIRPSVVRWTTSASAIPEALASGEAVIGFASSARIESLKESGAPVDYTWNQAVISIGYWMIPKGAKHKDLALKFLEFQARAEQQAALGRFNVAVVNRHAMDLLTEKQRTLLASAPQNLAREFEFDPAAWSRPGPSGKSIYDENVARWIAWSAQQ